MLESVTNTALTSALDGLAARQRAIADNIANVNTPGYRAQRVAFEEALTASVRTGSGRTTPTTSLSVEPTQLNGNNVNLETETLANVDTVLRYQFASSAIGNQSAALRAALRTTS
ncbi:flagellar biosynthesis protein FlgB [Tersicoccus phoenicis]|uniref:Flagellar basal body rod protein FlgB n=1 Tax=Tersicoccus phoenicis TaxID=554083 RepID=A0A1R1L7L5_9MICC|nr:flagellar basal body protein [Tersicoccus phoenicis]OMH23528.1 flagellar biosynthesis protein FlgB [Tersicoccus phoenicis]